jgi:hypothetical protein
MIAHDNTRKLVFWTDRTAHDTVNYVAAQCIYADTERLGLIPDDLADLDAVTKRLRDEAAGAQALAVMPSVICAWARV